MCLRLGPWLIQSEGGPHARATGATMDAPEHLRHGTERFQNERGLRAYAAGASVDPNRRWPPGPCGGGLDDPKAKEAPKLLRTGLRWYQSEGGSRANAAEASVVPNGRMRLCDGGLRDSKVTEAPPPLWRGPSGVPKRRRPRRRGRARAIQNAKEALMTLRRGPRWCQSEAAPRANAVVASMIPI